MKPNREAVAKRLKKIREDSGMSIAIMAERIGISKSTLNSYLRALALPPEEIIGKIALLAGVSKEWIYYGEIKNYIHEYLLSCGYEKLLNDYPETIDELYSKWLKMQNSDHAFKEYPHPVTINDLFYDIYSPIFIEYLNRIANDFAEKIPNYPLYSEGPEYNIEKFLTRVRALVRREQPTIKYGEDERVYKVAETEFNTRVELYINQVNKVETKSEDFLDFMIENLKTTRGTLEIISIITSQRGLDYDIGSKKSDEIIELFKGMYPELIKIKEKYLDK
ncbi:helix-turn-helix domain-containing protein [Bacillus sp. BP-3]|uniref:helix-turn-helix domain-containing protein n=1 Tax=Bacillus sp. BP-3 TaxID=3022773 RepID=UPI00232E582B|nr:helix-turn-helix transcriptional regulator [Bacillus sp. BP-3]MDC2867808.1 helix-turn-helix transcriptional regulator [Bacillus sp. BP-3]